ncbi:hypothetical protein D3C86_1952810 [compost metagenome]
MIAVGQRQADRGGAGESGGDARHDDGFDPGGADGLKLLAAATEDEGIAALQPNDAVAGAGLVDHQLFDLVLRH